MDSKVKFNWKYALGEVMLIFIGISLAFGLQTYYENRKNDIEHRLILSQIKNNLIQDSISLNDALKFLGRVDTSLQTIMQPDVAIGRIMPLLGFLQATLVVPKNTAAFDLYKASGKLQLMDNDLALDLQTLYLLYESWEPDEDFYRELIENGMRPIVNELMSTNEMRRSKPREIPKNALKALAESEALYAKFWSQRITALILSDHYKQGKINVLEMLESIDKRLNE